jgi:hypothetical protein
VSEATKLWKTALESDYKSWRKIIDKETGEVTVKVKRNEGDDWEELA